MDATNIKLVSYNCRGLKLGNNCYFERLEVEKLLVDYDICQQETWLSKQQQVDPKCMYKKCNAVANSPNDDSQGITVGRKRKVLPYCGIHSWTPI